MKGILTILMPFASIILFSCHNENKGCNPFECHVTCDSIDNDTMFINIRIKNKSNQAYYLNDFFNYSHGLKFGYIVNNTISYFEPNFDISIRQVNTNEENVILKHSLYRYYKEILNKVLEDTLNKKDIYHFCLDNIKFHLNDLAFLRPNEEKSIRVWYIQGNSWGKYKRVFLYQYNFKVYESPCFKESYLPKEMNGYKLYKGSIASDTVILKPYKSKTIIIYPSPVN